MEENETAGLVALFLQERKQKKCVMCVVFFFTPVHDSSQPF